MMPMYGSLHLSVLGVQVETWQALEAIAVTVGVGVAVLGLLGLGVALCELREQTKARHLQALIATIDQFTEVASPKIRHWFESLDVESVATLTGSDRTKVLSILYAFNRVGLLIDQGLVPAEPVLMLFGGIALRYREKLLPLISQRLDEWPDSRAGIYYERLCERARDWMNSGKLRE